MNAVLNDPHGGVGALAESAMRAVDALSEMEKDEKQNAHEAITTHILESALFALGGITEQSSDACTEVYNIRGLVRTLVRCSGASSPSRGTPRKRSKNREIVAKLPNELQRIALWVLDSVLRQQASLPFHKSAVPELLAAETGGLERLVEICSSPPPLREKTKKKKPKKKLSMS